jgi:hypothetical protein
MSIDLVQARVSDGDIEKIAKDCGLPSATVRLVLLALSNNRMQARESARRADEHERRYGPEI